MEMSEKDAQTGGAPQLKKSKIHYNVLQQSNKGSVILLFEDLFVLLYALR